MGIEDYEWDRQARGYDDTGGERVCRQCILDPDLRVNLTNQLEDTGDACVGCRRRGATVAGKDVLEEWLSAVHLLYGDALGFMPIEQGRFVFSTTDAREVVEENFAGDVTDEVFAALYKYIRFDVDLAQDIDDSDALELEWDRLREVLGSPAGSTTTLDLDTRFLRSFEGLLTRNLRLLRTEPARSRYWRVRKLDPTKPLDGYDSAEQMGAPIPVNASDNRFSCAGQPAFYGAPASSTSIAEVFQGGVTGTAVQASFVSVRDLTFLDLVDLPATPSIYDKSQTELFLVLRFLRRFAKDVSRPVDKTTTEYYLPTQRITDVVRSLTDPVIDGIRYESSQDGLPSVIIFAQAKNCADPGKARPWTLLVYEPSSLTRQPVP